MNIKIQNTSPNKSGSDNKGSCAALATYLEHEDEKRLAEGKGIMPFLTPEGIEVTKAEVIDKIDRNHAHFGKNDDKFYSIIVSPSSEEIKAMGETEEEQYESGLKLIRAISDNYAQNFNREVIKTASDLIIFWKFHFTRGNDGDLQFHMHGIVSRNSKVINGKQVKISPMTKHTATEKGPVQGGFRRTTLFEKAEKLFDMLFHYDRKVAETFAYENAMKHGTPEQKAEQAKLLAQEKKQEMMEKIANGINNRRESVKSQNEINELTALLEAEHFEFPKESKTLESAIDLAGLKNIIMHIFDISADKSALDLNLLAAGLMCDPSFGPEKGVDDIIFIRNGKTIPANSIMDLYSHRMMLGKWKSLTGQKPTFEIRAEIAAKLEAERSRKLSEKLSQVSRGLKIKM